MDKIPDGWQLDFYLGVGEPDIVFLKRLDKLLSIIHGGVLDRVSSEDLWAIIRAVVVALDTPIEK